MLGLAALVILYFTTNALGLTTVGWLIRVGAIYIPFALLVAFHAEIRNILLAIGRSALERLPTLSAPSEQGPQVAAEIANAAAQLSQNRYGALIVLERRDNLDQKLQGGTQLDADLRAELLVSIFAPHSPLHDGAVIIRNGRIRRVGAVLPVSRMEGLYLGLRHRAGVGITEDTDALSVIVSEETGLISLAAHGRLVRPVEPEFLREQLEKALQ